MPRSHQVQFFRIACALSRIPRIERIGNADNSFPPYDRKMPTRKNLIDINRTESNGVIARTSVRWKVANGGREKKEEGERDRERKSNRIDLISVVCTRADERVRKRRSTNDVPFHLATRCCVSSQTEITHGNLAVPFPAYLPRDPRN